jgi:hypothetical protein
VPRRWVTRATRARNRLPCMAWRAAAISRLGRNGGGAGPGAGGAGECAELGGGSVSCVILAPPTRCVPAPYVSISGGGVL